MSSCEHSTGVVPGDPARCVLLFSFPRLHVVGGRIVGVAVADSPLLVVLVLLGGDASVWGTDLGSRPEPRWMETRKLGIIPLLFLTFHMDSISLSRWLELSWCLESHHFPRPLGRPPGEQIVSSPWTTASGQLLFPFPPQSVCPVSRLPA